MSAQATDPSLAYDAAIAALSIGVIGREETPADAAFLTELFIECSPLRTSLPQPMLDMQARLQQVSYQDTYPEAMRRIIARSEGAIARVMIDWTVPDDSLLVDIAVRPCVQRQGIGLALLKCWIAVADASGRRCRLSVLADNPARALYARLGFTVSEGAVPPFLTMERSGGS